MKSLGQLLTDQIVDGEITVEQARHTIVAYYRRKREKRHTILEMKLRMARQAIKDNGGNFRAAARDLGVGVTTIYRWFQSPRNPQPVEKSY